MSDQQYWFFLYSLEQENDQHELFVGQADAKRAMSVLQQLAANAE